MHDHVCVRVYSNEAIKFLGVIKASLTLVCVDGSFDPYTLLDKGWMIIMELKKQFQSLMVFRDGTRYRLGMSDTREEAMLKIDENFEYNRGKIKMVGGIGIESKKYPGPQPYDIVGYEIRVRKITPWESVEVVEVGDQS